LPRGTVTFLFTDIEGSTELARKLGADFGRVRGEHRRILREAFGRHGGHEIDTAGDGFFVVFERAGDAVGAAVAAQRALNESQLAQDVAVRVRMGPHSGEPYVDEDGYVGVGVHRAARICAAGHGGQILLSNATAGIVEDLGVPG
jgi:class 3 adenylate cyclase